MRKLILTLCCLLTSVFGYLDISSTNDRVIIRNGAIVGIGKRFEWGQRAHGRNKIEFNTLGGKADLVFGDISSLIMDGSLRTINGTLNFDMENGGMLIIKGGGSWSADTSDMDYNYNALTASLEGRNEFLMNNGAVVDLNENVRAFGNGSTNRFLMDNSTLKVKGALAVSGKGGSENLIRGVSNTVTLEGVLHNPSGVDAGPSNNTIDLTNSSFVNNGYVYSNWAGLDQGGNYFTFNGGKQVFKGNIDIHAQNKGYNRFEVTGADITFGGNSSNISYLSMDDKTIVRYGGSLTIQELAGTAGGIFAKDSQDPVTLNIVKGSGSYAFRANSSVTTGQLVATTSEGITFTTEKTDDGLIVTSLSLKAKSNGNGVKSWFVSGYDKVISQIAIKETETILSSPYDIYLYNFNSLNKRMGELRGNNTSHGLWTRVFGGSGSNEYTNTKNMFVTVQAGYDYGFQVSKGYNYLGIAGSYGYGDSKITNSKMKTELYEAAIYNSYVEDEGWFNDTVFKVGVLNNDYAKNSLTYTFSNEFGYRFKLGENKKWFIDPQVELSAGYIDGSEFTLSNTYSSLKVNRDALLMLRTRAGMSIGYDFGYAIKEGLNSNFYIGGFAEVDNYLLGDGRITGYDNDIKVKGRYKGNDYRGVLNYGFNIEGKEGINFYLDAEHSFGGKVKIDYKVNGGLRFSFGEKVKEVQNETENPIKLKEVEDKES